MADVYGELYAAETQFRYEPSIYWVDVKGRDDRGRDRVKHVILFRNDWLQLRVGDRWSATAGFAPREAGK